jgi:hypothetical protein
MTTPEPTQPVTGTSSAAVLACMCENFLYNFKAAKRSRLVAGLRSVLLGGRSSAGHELGDALRMGEKVPAGTLAGDPCGRTTRPDCGRTLRVHDFG